MLTFAERGAALWRKPEALILLFAAFVKLWALLRTQIVIRWAFSLLQITQSMRE